MGTTMPGSTTVSWRNTTGRATLCVMSLSTRDNRRRVPVVGSPTANAGRAPCNAGLLLVPPPLQPCGSRTNPALQRATKLDGVGDRTELVGVADQVEAGHDAVLHQ